MINRSTLQSHIEWRYFWIKLITKRINLQINFNSFDILINHEMFA